MTRNPTSSARRILVVEDDESIAMGLDMNLTAEGYQVEVAQNGEEGLSMARSGEYDLLILDVMLPKLNGFEVLRQLRQADNPVSVIMLSARGAEMDKVMGLELGAEDYVTKPFGLAELLARVKAVLRRDARGKNEPVQEVRFGDVVVNVAAREVFRDGEQVELTATEFDVLYCLIEVRGRVLSRDQIQAAVWGQNHHGTTRTIDNFMLQLRQKLEREPQRPQHLITVRGVGYRFVPLTARCIDPPATPMDPHLLRSYLATIYEIPSPTGPVRVSLDGESRPDQAALPEILTKQFALLTAYNPRSMLLPRRVNEARHVVLRDLLILGCYRVEQCLGYEEEPEGLWREPAWLVHGMEREEACAFGRVYRQNTIIYCREARPELIVTDPTCDDLGRTFLGNWRLKGLRRRSHVLRAAEPAHHQPERRRVVHPVRRPQPLGVVVERAAPQDPLAQPGDGIAPREPLLVGPLQLALGLHDLVARAWHALGGGGAAVRIGVVVVAYPLPDVAREIEVAVGPGAPGPAADLGGGGLAEDGLVVGAQLVSPWIQPGVVAARGVLPLGLGRQPLADPAAVGERVVPRDGADGLLRLPERAILADLVDAGRALVVAAADALVDAAAVGLVGDLGRVEPHRLERDLVRRVLVGLAEIVRAHGEGSPGNQQHPLGRRLRHGRRARRHRRAPGPRAARCRGRGLRRCRGGWLAGRS
jgi:two-component system, OmpR family, alkaline phosphatase synthesis response regulator PhoP